MGVENHVRKLRQERKITQVQMAADLSTSRQTIIAIENNKYNPSLEMALKISDYFDVPLQKIFYLKDS